MSVPRKSSISRNTAETRIKVDLVLDGTGEGVLDVGIPFLEHMLDQLKKHACIDLTVEATGDLEVDHHHTVEDLGISLGQAFDQALGDKCGIHRYGHAYVPLDEALARTVIDFSGRPGLEYHVTYPRAHIGEFDVDLIREFFQGFANHARATLHIDSLQGRNSHHIAETIFKSFARAIRVAVSLDARMGDALPSTKNLL